MRKLLSLGFIVCVVGFFMTDSAKGEFFVAGLILLLLIGLAEKIAEWLGLDDPPRTSRTRSEFFFDEASNLVGSGNATILRDVGDRLLLDGMSFRILERGRDEDGDFIYRVRPL